ncbi:MAG: YggS family pyridoxal phosphate-dependent enzyme [Nostocoides sp.]
MTDRRAALAAGLAAVERRIETACWAAGRNRSDLTLVVVTKHFPASDVEVLRALGVTDMGENRDQEASEKFAGLAERGRLTLHFVGQVQTNKAAHVASYADVVHSVDRQRLVVALDGGAARAGRRLRCLIQVGLEEEALGRGGAAPDAAVALADAVAASEHLDLAGVMAVAPIGADPKVAFARLGEVAAGIRQAHPNAVWISAGMSGDLEAAIGAGATHLRVGTAILGTRASLR